jgi:hypothetical protein
MAISVLDPVSKAWERMMMVCFRPFDLQKWLGLGFCAWLAMLGEGGGGNVQLPGGGGGEGGNPFNFDPSQFEPQETDYNDYSQALDASGLWGGASPFPNLDLDFFTSGIFLGVVIAAVVVGLILGLVMAWLNARGTFMFIDGIVHNRGDVKRPWAEYRAQGNSLFKVALVMAATAIGLVLAIGGCGAAVIVPSLNGDPNPATLIPTALGFLFLLFLCLIPLMIFGFVLDHFVAPIMYLRRVTFSEAWPMAKAEVISGHLGPILAYFGMQIVLGFGAAIIAVLLTCITCCVAALPFVGTVLMLPLFVFMKSYSLYFVQEFGPALTLFKDEDQGATASW